jgi:hypothetical protein
MNTLDYIHLTNETLRAKFLSERLLYFSNETYTKSIRCPFVRRGIVLG